MTLRAGFYIDGFNVYHALDRLGQDHLKWLDWHALASLLIPQTTERVERVVMCTAIKTTDTAKMLRHRTYIRALESKGVLCLRGHFADDPRSCRACGDAWDAPTEKQGDVNLAVSIIDDVHRGVVDHVYLVTADGDQVPTLKLLSDHFQEVKTTTLVMTGHSHNKYLLRYAGAKITIGVDHLEKCLFPRLIPGANAISRPTEYDPPPGWVAPHLRP